jgi:hypothetical protein
MQAQIYARKLTKQKKFSDCVQIPAIQQSCGNIEQTIPRKKNDKTSGRKAGAE